MQSFILEEKSRWEKDKALASDGTAVHLWKDGGKQTSERSSMAGMIRVGSGGLRHGLEVTRAVTGSIFLNFVFRACESPASWRNSSSKDPPTQNCV